jgi:hypothetical protein
VRKFKRYEAAHAAEARAGDALAEKASAPVDAAP